MPDFSFQITASAVAWYGAIVATISLLISLYKVWVDRSNVEVYGWPNAIIQGDNRKHVFIEVVNNGRRPVTITKMGLTLYDGKKAIVVGSLKDQELTEGRRTAVTTYQDFDPNSIKYLWALDASGKMYKKYMSRFPTFKTIFWQLGRLLRVRS